jgi:hypothetical protein
VEECDVEGTHGFIFGNWEIEGRDLLVLQITVMAVGFGINVSITDLDQIFTIVPSLFDEFLCKLGFFGTSGPV